MFSSLIKKAANTRLAFLQASARPPLALGCRKHVYSLHIKYLVIQTIFSLAFAKKIKNAFADASKHAARLPGASLTPALNNTSTSGKSGTAF